MHRQTVDGDVTDEHLAAAREAAETLLSNPVIEDVVSVRVLDESAADEDADGESDGAADGASDGDADGDSDEDAEDAAGESDDAEDDEQ